MSLSHFICAGCWEKGEADSRMFDHVAHLGGALFGVLYYQYGREIWYRLRKEMYVAAERRDESMGRR